MPQARKLAQTLDHSPEPDMAQRRVTTLSHRERQNPKPRPHRQILMLVQRLTPARRLVMNTGRRRHVKHLPAPAQTITKIEILARRTARKERRKPTHRLERLAAQRANAAADPLARNRCRKCRWKSVW